MSNNYVLLERITTTSSVASVTLNNIPQTGYTDLVIRVSARTVRATEEDGLYMVINGLNSTGFRDIEGNGTTTSSVGTASYGNNWVTRVNGGTSTANTFGNAEIYISNYSSNSFKSISIDGVTENNATLSYMNLVSSLWSYTAGITTLSFACNANFTAGCTFSLYGIATVGVTPVLSPQATGGDIIDTDGTYYYHTFLSSGVFTPNKNLTCDYLVVAGGGAGGGGTSGWNGGGGGAGGLRSTVTATGGAGTLETALSLTAGTSYAAAVGAGGVAALSIDGSNGSNSVFASITSTGGGFGGSSTAVGAVGGSGGGRRGGTGASAGSIGTPNQGFAGGGGGNAGGAGGVGGAGAIGIDGSTTVSTSGAGGIGVTVSITGSSVTYAGGGGGGANTPGAGGSGGGGGGSSSTTGTAGIINTGGGGGGGFNNPDSAGGSGGSGIIVVRYLA